MKRIGQGSALRFQMSLPMAAPDDRTPSDADISSALVQVQYFCMNVVAATKASQSLRDCFGPEVSSEFMCCLSSGWHEILHAALFIGTCLPDKHLSCGAHLKAELSQA